MDMTAVTASQVVFAREGRGYARDAVEIFRSAVVAALVDAASELEVARARIGELEADRPDSAAARTGRMRDFVESFELLFAGSESVAAAREERAVQVAIGHMLVADRSVAAEAEAVERSARHKSEANQIISKARELAEASRAAAAEESNLVAASARTIVDDARRRAYEQVRTTARLAQTTHQAEQRLEALTNHVKAELRAVSQLVSPSSLEQGSVGESGYTEANAPLVKSLLPNDLPPVEAIGRTDFYNQHETMLDLTGAASPDIDLRDDRTVYERRLGGLRARIKAAEAADREAALVDDRLDRDRQDETVEI